MNIEWRQFSEDLELWINSTNMGWVDDENRVHCMWMTYSADDDPSAHLIESQYPEDHVFEMREDAKAALLEPAVVMYVGGFRGR